MQTVTVTLSEPVELKGVVTTELTFRKLKTGDLVAADSFSGEMAKLVAMLASMAETTIQTIQETSAEDFGRIVLEVAPLMGKSVQAAGSIS